MEALALTTTPDQDLAAAPKKWTTLSVAASLQGSPITGEWEPGPARRVIEREGFDPAALLAQAAALLRPVTERWLTERLWRLWGSTTPSSSMNADVWLDETIRALADYPQHIAAHAIDAAYHASTRGFTPSAGEIVTIAAPLLAELRRQHARLDAIVHPKPRQRRPWEPEDADDAGRCSPEDAARICAEMGIASVADAPTREARGPARMPTAQDYVDLGLSPEAAAQAVGGGQVMDKEQPA